MCLVDLLSIWKWFDQSNPLCPFFHRNHCKHYTFVYWNDRIKSSSITRAQFVCHNFQELGDLRERTHTLTQTVCYELQKQNEQRRKKTLSRFLLLLLFLFLYIRLALVTNNCVARFSRFSPLTVLFCPSHDVCISVYSCEASQCYSQHKWKFFCRSCFLLISSLNGFYYIQNVAK